MELLGREAFPASADWGWERVRDKRTAKKQQRGPGKEPRFPRKGAPNLWALFRTDTAKQRKMFAFFISEKVTSAVLKERIGSPPQQCGQRGLGPGHRSLRVRPGWAAARARGS